VRCLERVIEFDAIGNFRDVGGMPTRSRATVRRGVVFRSGTLTDATDADLRRLGGLSIRTVVDLREEEVQQEHPDRLPEGQSVRVLCLPMMNPEIGRFSEQWAILMDGRRPDVDSRTLARDVYASFFRDFRGHVLELLAAAALEENLPLLVHCAAGKDRTGLMVALLLSQLGVAYEHILQDYLLTNWCRQDIRDRMASEHPFPELVRSFTEAREEYLRAAFRVTDTGPELLDAHVVEQLGISDDLTDRLRHVLLDVDGRSGRPGNWRRNLT
jgi:protein-tyrosine phosphatase